MPEGDSVHHHGTRLRGPLVGSTVLRADSRFAGVASGLAGQTVQAVTTHGKHLLVHLETVVLRLHLRMKGSIVLGETPPPISGALGLLLVTDAVAVACFYVEVERIATRRLATHPALSALGPDLMVRPLDLPAIVARARRRPTRPIGETLLDQRVAAGIGNVYKSEVLFFVGVHPEMETGALSEETLAALYDQASHWLIANGGPGKRTTTGRLRPRLYVYGGRHGCLRCGGYLSVKKQGANARVTWWCPRCQSRTSPL